MGKEEAEPLRFLSMSKKLEDEFLGRWKNEPPKDGIKMLKNTVESLQPYHQRKRSRRRKCSWREVRDDTESKMIGMEEDGMMGPTMTPMIVPGDQMVEDMDQELYAYISDDRKNSDDWEIPDDRMVYMDHKMSDHGSGDWKVENMEQMLEDKVEDMDHRMNDQMVGEVEQGW